jgi:hypothetical protein
VYAYVCVYVCMHCNAYCAVDSGGLDCIGYKKVSKVFFSVLMFVSLALFDVAGTWEEKNVTDWAVENLTQQLRLTDVVLPADHAGKV